MAEVNPGDKVVYGTFVGTVKQLLGEDECVIGLRTPMSDGAVTIIAKIKSCEVVSEFQPELEPQEKVEETSETPIEKSAEDEDTEGEDTEGEKE